MLEKLATVLQNAWDGEEGLPPIAFSDGEAANLVTAILQALRDPDEGMTKAGDYMCYASFADGEREEQFAGDSLPIWQAMIDHILNTTTSEEG